MTDKERVKILEDEVRLLEKVVDLLEKQIEVDRSFARKICMPTEPWWIQPNTTTIGPNTYDSFTCDDSDIQVTFTDN